MRLPGPLEARLEVLRSERRRLLGETDVAELEDAEVRVRCDLAGNTSCIQLRLKPQDIQFLREGMCADFALLLARGDDDFEAHVLELKKTVSEKVWNHVQQQLEWAAVHLLAIAGVLHIRIHSIVTYTAFREDRLSREGSPNPVGAKIPIGPPADTDPNVRRWAEARRSWQDGRVRMAVFDQDVDHVRLRADATGRAAVVCRMRSTPGEHDTRWRFEPVAE